LNNLIKKKIVTVPPFGFGFVFDFGFGFGFGFRFCEELWSEADFCRFVEVV